MVFSEAKRIFQSERGGHQFIQKGYDICLSKMSCLLIQGKGQSITAQIFYLPLVLKFRRELYGY